MAVGLTVLKVQLCTLGEVDEVEVGEEGTASIHGRLGGVDPPDIAPSFGEQEQIPSLTTAEIQDRPEGIRSAYSTST